MQRSKIYAVCIYPTRPLSLLQAGPCDATAFQAIQRVLSAADPCCFLHPPHMSLHERSWNLLLHTRKLL